jgi:hypothetical protein
MSLVNDPTESASLDLFKGPSESIFAFFNELTLPSYVQGIQPDAKFLFAKLTRLNLYVYENCEVEVMIKNFEECCQKRLEFVFLRLHIHKPIIEITYPGLFSRVNKLEIWDDDLNEFTTIDLLEKLFAISEENKNSTSVSSFWSELTEFTIISFMNKQNRNPTADLKEQTMTKLEKNMLRQASNLVVFDLFNREPILLSPNSFCFVQKLRVLRLRRVIIDSFEIFDCLVDLEELKVELDCELLSRRVTKFALLPKLTKLTYLLDIKPMGLITK